jgi:hypothetical protein
MTDSHTSRRGFLKATGGMALVPQLAIDDPPGIEFTQLC